LREEWLDELSEEIEEHRFRRSLKRHRNR